MATTTVLASSYVNMSNLTQTTAYPITRAYTDTSSTTYAQLTLSKKNGESSIDFTFDFSGIPSNAVVAAITVKIKCMVNSTSYVSAAAVQAYKNGAAVGSSTSYRTTSASVYTLNVGSWSREDLNNFAIHVYGKKANTNSTAYIRVYGMEVAVTWEEPPQPTETIYYKDAGTWKAASKVYKKVGGVWVEQSSLSGVFVDGVNYVKG